MALFTVITVNVRGLRDMGKRGGVFQYLSCVSFQVCFLQEVHLRDMGDVPVFSKEWAKGESRWGIGGVHSSGVGILFGDRDFCVVGSFSVIQGRVLVVDADWRGAKFRFINIYAPAEPRGRKDLFLALPDICVTNRTVVLGGDFNVSFEGTGDFSLPYLVSVVKDFSFRDSFRVCDPKGEGMTWANSRGSRSRIDFIFLPVSVPISQVTVSPVWFSDHCQVQVVFSVDVPIFGRGFWKLNSQILADLSFREAFRSHYELWGDLKPFFGSLVEWWECVKRNVRTLAISHCVAKARADREVFRRLQGELTALVSAENKGEGRDVERMEVLKSKLGLYFQGKARDFLFRCQRDKFEFGEASSSYFFKQVKAAHAKAVIAQLRTEKGGMVSDPKGMVEAASSFYQESFREKDIDGSKEHVFLGFLREKVPPEEASDLDRPFELEEVEAALRGLPTNKVPGCDGLPREFYVTFWEILGRDFLLVDKAVYDSGLLGSSMREGILTLLYKKGERDNLGNYRPITLLCADYKVVARVLAGRLRKALPHVIHEDQTCGVEGRSIQWNLSLVRDCIAWAQDRGVHLMLVGLDMEKAFDKVHHGFLFSVLERMGFGAGFMRWVEILYTAVGSRVLVNGHAGEVVPQQTGVRQGCPLSPLLFVLYMEPLAAAIRADARIRGLRPPGGGSSEVKISQYADDMTLFLTSEGSVARAVEVLGEFGLASGARVNLGKSSVKFFGPWAGREEGLSGLPLCSGPMRVLGVDFEVTGSEGINWGQRIAKVRTKVGLWKARRLSMSGRVLVIKADILPSLVYLAYVFPLPPRYRKDLVRTIFSFVWGGYEYIKRDWMVQSVEEGGRGVPDIPLKLDTIFFSSICKSLVNPCNHGYKAFALFWLSFPLRRLIAWDNSRPKAESLPAHFEHAVKWSRRHTECQEGLLCMDHRALYRTLVAKRGPVGVYGVGPVVWQAIQQKGLSNRLKDLNWLCIHGRLPVREVLYRHGLSKVKICPREGCEGEETLRHTFWECSYARRVWGDLGSFFQMLGILSFDAIMLRRGLGIRSGRGSFLIWLLISLGKVALWDSRAVLVKSNVDWGVGGVVSRVRADLRKRFDFDVDKYGFHASKERWKYLYE